MSASEKLKALDTGRELYADEGYHMYVVAKEENILVRALPQIVAVVEAAAGAKRYLLEDANGTTSQSDYYGALADLDRALSALEEALS